MRINASENFLAAARAAGREVLRKVYIRGKEVRDSDLTGNWTDVSDYVSEKSFPTCRNSVELNLSQFTADSITLTGIAGSLKWWDDNIFSYAHFLEAKIVFIIAGLTGDAISVFSGWVEKKKNKFVVKRTVKTGVCSFKVWSYQDYAGDVSAATLLTQYIKSDVDGLGNDGLILPHIKNVFVLDAAISGFELKKGIHTVTYRYDVVDGATAKLDDGEFTVLTDTTTLVNGAGDQKITVFALFPYLSGSADEVTDDIIVYPNSATLPKQWYHGSGARFLLTKLFEKIGITSVSFDTLEYPTADGNTKLSFVTIPPTLSDKNTIAAKGGLSLLTYVGSANNIYEYSQVTQTFVLKQTLTGEYPVWMGFDDLNDHVWFYTNTENLYRLETDTNTLSSPVSLPGALSRSFAVVNYLNDDDTHEYAVICLVDGTDVTRIDGNTLSISTIYSEAFTDVSHCIVINTNTSYYIVENNDPTYRRLFYNTTTKAWSMGLSPSIADYYIYKSAYVASENRIYFIGYNATHTVIASFPFDTGSVQPVTILATLYSGFDAEIEADGAIKESGNFDCAFAAPSTGDFYKLQDNTALIIGKNVVGKYSSMVESSGKILGVDEKCRLYQVDIKIAVYIETGKFDGMKVRSAIDEICSSFNFIYKIGSNKTARVQRRINADGDLVTSGNSVVLNSDNFKDITEESVYGQVYDMVSVDNGKKKVTYDGSGFHGIAFVEETIFPIDSNLIPDEIIEDIAFNAYQYHHTPHKVYVVPSPAALLQFESLDGAEIIHEGQMSIDTEGVIVSDAVDKNTRCEFTIVVNA